MTWVPGPRSHRELRDVERGPPSWVVPQREELHEGGQDHRGAARGEGRRHGRAFEDDGEVQTIFFASIFSTQRYAVHTLFLSKRLLKSRLFSTSGCSREFHTTS